MMIKLHFSILLENYQVDELIRPNGALFNRWLPNGLDNAIDIPVTHKDNTLRIWFERRGSIRNGFIRYNSEILKEDTQLISRQAKLDSGPLIGESDFHNILDDEFIAIRDDKVGSQEYIALAKRIINFLYPPLSNFIFVLRTQYGQYWLRELEPWDSRKRSLGDYCRSTLDLCWSDNGRQWNRFRPTDQSVNIHLPSLPGKGFGEYLTKDDWNNLSSSFDPYKSPSLASVILGRAHRLFDQGESRQSFVEGVTALELSMSELIYRNLSNQQRILSEAINIFNNPQTGVRDKFKLVSVITGLISDEAFEKTLEAIDIRNEIVHKGDDSGIGKEDTLFALFNTITIFLEKEIYKFPVLVNGNMLYAVD
jgi:hypothetical protein